MKAPMVPLSVLPTPQRRATPHVLATLSHRLESALDPRVGVLPRICTADASARVMPEVARPHAGHAERPHAGNAENGSALSAGAAFTLLFTVAGAAYLAQWLSLLGQAFLGVAVLSAFAGILTAHARLRRRGAKLGGLAWSGVVLTAVPLAAWFVLAGVGLGHAFGELLPYTAFLCLGAGLFHPSRRVLALLAVAGGACAWLQWPELVSLQNAAGVALGVIVLRVVLEQLFDVRRELSTRRYLSAGADHDLVQWLIVLALLCIPLAAFGLQGLAPVAELLANPSTATLPIGIALGALGGGVVAVHASYELVGQVAHWQRLAHDRWLS